jgi:ABC-type bacteriocin/lantibiotic exporter with double-glycine peptidase domain
MNAETGLAVLGEDQKSPSGLACLVIVARQHGLHLTTEQLVHDNLLSGPQVSFADLIKCAEKAGLSPQIIAELKANKRPANMQPDEAAVYDFVMELSTRHEVSDATFARAKMLLGEQQVVDLTAVTGTYATIAMLLAMAEEGVPPGKESPFKTGDP